MRSTHNRKAEGLLEDGERVLAALVARPLRWPLGTAGSLALGAAQDARAHDEAAEAGLPLASRTSLVLTDRRLLALRIGSLFARSAGRAGEPLGAVPLTQVDSIEVERLARGPLVTITVGGRPVRVEAGPFAGARALASAFEDAKGGARPAPRRLPSSASSWADGRPRAESGTA